jgi:hypothetical protein
MSVTVQDGVIEPSEEEGIFAFVDVPFREWRPNLAYS